MIQQKAAADLWRDYAFLTREIVKFVGEQNYNLVLELIGQRDKLQALIEATPDNDFTQTPAGRELLQSVQDQNQQIITGLRWLYNNAKRSRQISNAYDQNAGFASGTVMDRQS